VRLVRDLSIAIILLALAYMLLSPHGGGGFDAEGVAVRVVDGDTLVVKVEESRVEDPFNPDDLGWGGEVKVRLADISVAGGVEEDLR